jgi:chromosome segregation ATPase
MGGLIYSDVSKSNNDMNNMNEKLQSLQNQIDKNKDNVVTQEEFRAYLICLAEKVDQNRDGIVSQHELKQYLDNQLAEKDKEIEKWKQAFEQLHEEYETKLDNLVKGDTIIQDNRISIPSLKTYIKDEIINTNANLKYIPDALEKKIYLSVYTTVMKSIERLCQTTSIDMMNHRITFNIQPITNKKN